MQPTNNQIERAQWWVKTWAGHHTELKTPVALVYAQETMHMTEAQLKHAASEWMRSNRKAPMPSDLIAIVSITDEQIADRVGPAIWRALNYRGWPTRKNNMNFNVPDEKAVYEWLGNVGAAVVQRKGGFHKMLDNLGDYDEHWSPKNWTEDAKIVIQDVRAGRENLALPAGDTVKQISNVVEFKKFPERGGPRPNFEDLEDRGDNVTRMPGPPPEMEPV